MSEADFFSDGDGIHDSDLLALAEAIESNISASRSPSLPSIPSIPSEFAENALNDEGRFSPPEGVYWPAINSSQEQRVGPDWLPPGVDDEFLDGDGNYGGDMEAMIQEEEMKAYGIEIASPIHEYEDTTVPDDSSSDIVTVSATGPIIDSSLSQKRRLTRESVDLTNSNFPGADTKRRKLSDSEDGVEGFRRPFVRGPFPAEVQPRGVVEGLNTRTVVKTCFRIGEAISVGVMCGRRPFDSEADDVLVELYGMCSDLSSEDDTLLILPSPSFLLRACRHQTEFPISWYPTLKFLKTSSDCIYRSFQRPPSVHQRILRQLAAL